MVSSKATSRQLKEKKKSSKSSSKPTTKTKVTTSPQNFKSTEFVAESDDEKDEPKEANPSFDSDNDSLPSNPAVKSTFKSKSKSNGKAAESSDSSEAESGEESESGSGSDEEEGEGSDEESESNANGNKSAAPLPSKKNAKTVSLKVAPFKPPPGFEKSSSKNSSEALQLFSESYLEGKEIWYITAPASVPINSVKEISLQDAKLGKAVFSQEGNDYGFVHDTLEDKTYTKILLPCNYKDGYSIEKKPIDRIYRIQQVINLSKNTSSQATVPAKRPVRQQPKGLKARYQPIGFASAPGIIGPDDDESDSEERAPKFQKIAMSEDEASDVEMEEAPPASIPAKKSKSDKSKKSEKDSREGVDQSSKKKHKDSGDKKKRHKSSFTPTSHETQELKNLKKQAVTELANQSIPLRLRANSPSDSDPETTTNTRASQLSILPPSKAFKSSNSDTALSRTHPTTSNSTTNTTKKKATGVVGTQDPGTKSKDEARREKKAQKEAKRRRLESRTDNF
ncbi:hypothetical protein DSL72_001029 [Monilinia vaccinii-corymbosi]|uniref:DNA-directed RNA polymerase I subunit RPA34.5 n=1 Tax=Monilinia vaccinii-corymbosi TaxID=61207 RepID=A0A8A3P5C3_9HELO|nr:hypothetical protein DSL72_001029 [Monilinia vaccinii-corymbosi]